jgi:hypothetical protein
MDPQQLLLLEVALSGVALPPMRILNGVNVVSRPNNVDAEVDAIFDDRAAAVPQVLLRSK